MTIGAIIRQFQTQISLMEILDNLRVRYLRHLGRRVRGFVQGRARRLERSRIETMIQHANFFYHGRLSWCVHENNRHEFRLSKYYLIKFAMETAVHLRSRYSWRRTANEMTTAINEWSWNYLAVHDRFVFDDAALDRIRTATRFIINAMPPYVG